MSAPEATDREELISAVAEELTRARQRGLDELDLGTSHQQPVKLPELERLARTYTGDGRPARIPPIRQLLADGLDAWAAQGFDEPANLVRRLFFAEGGKGGLRRPGQRLDRLRSELGLNEDAFDERRRAAFQQFARYLIDFAAARPGGSPPGQDSTGRRRRVWRVALPLLLLLAVGVVVAVLSLRPDGALEAGATAGGQATAEGTATATAGPTELPSATFRFDALGVPPWIINVYPGVEDTPADRLWNGTFRDGDVAPAVCKTRGRTVTSNPSIGEEFRQSDIWIQVLGVPGERHYASLTYGEMTPEELAALPEC